MYRVDLISTSSLFSCLNVISSTADDPSTSTVLMITPPAVMDFLSHWTVTNTSPWYAAREMDEINA